MSKDKIGAPPGVSQLPDRPLSKATKHGIAAQQARCAHPRAARSRRPCRQPQSSAALDSGSLAPLDAVMARHSDDRPDILLLCDCAGSMSLDDDVLKAASGCDALMRCTEACGRDLDAAARALRRGSRVILACEQEAARFASLAEELAEAAAAQADGSAGATAGQPPAELVFVDIRDRAGWSDEAPATAKQAALLADAALPRPFTPSFDITSPGTCFIIGSEAALDAARRLADELAVTLLLTELPDFAEPDGRFDIVRGRIRTAEGALGRFTVTLEDFAPARHSGRGPITFAPPQGKVASECDIILDLSGADPLFPAPHKRDGYLRADPRDRAAVERVIGEARNLVGTFEKPLYIRFEADLCAHSRAGKTGCTRCLDVCPTGAITPQGDHVHVDPAVCAGCGECAAVCPSGAASYDDPPAEFLFRRFITMMRAHGEAAAKTGERRPRLLVHDHEHGAEMIRLSARFGRGLPADVIPLAVNNVEGFGHAEMLAALGAGFVEVLVLFTPQTDRTVPERESNLARAILADKAGDPAGERIRLLDAADPDALEEALREPAPATPAAEPVMPIGRRRDVVRMVAQALHGEDAPPIPLPAGAPYGAVNVDTNACTLCLACASLCPAGALGDNPDKPQLRFQESACLQCGICEITCPENAMTLEPRLLVGPDALRWRVLHEEEPFACISCGKPFGVRSTIERISEQLAGKHWMYADDKRVQLIQMCDDCRIKAQYHGDNSPFRLGTPSRPRTTEDYLEGGTNPADKGPTRH